MDRQRLAFMLTDASLEPDPIFEGKICDRCMLCVKDCSGNAISKEETIKVRLAGKEIEWGKLDVDKCAIAYAGGVRETSPFYPRDPNFVPKTYEEGIPFSEGAMRWFHHPGAIEGAKGCIRACMIHLEETGKIKAKFVEPFRKRKPWLLTDDVWAKFGKKKYDEKIEDVS